MNRVAPWLRMAAIVIAIAGAIDPALTKSVPTKPDVSLVASGPLPDPALADRVARALDPIATVVRGPSIGASAVVSVGYQLPGSSVRPRASGSQVPATDLPVAFAVIPEPRSPWVSIESVRAPEHANLHARVPVEVTVRARAARGRSLVVQLEVGGVAIDTATRPVGSDDELVTVEMGLVATTTGRIAPTAAARIEGSATTAQADIAMRVGSERHEVLLFDRRPSWMSTFVRRALESDARFVVSSRISTSRDAAVIAGRAPAAMASLADPDSYDIVIIGAPDQLTQADADGLDAFMRDRAGVVLLLMDAATENAAVNRLTGVTRWVRANRPEPGGVPLASEIQSPAELPRWAEPVPFARAANPQSVTPVWQTPVGRGRLIVSGALDAWRYRDRDDAAFDKFWKLIAADATKEVTEKSTEGTERRAEGTEALRPATPDERAMLQAWTASHRGAVIGESELASLPSALAKALSAPVETRTIHPMRSAWWLIPFAGLLGIEWWHRRKNGGR